MAEWMHRCCERCWFDGYHGPPLMFTAGPGPDLFRLPTQVVGDEPGVCCACAGATVTGIYVRRDQNELRCKGRHDDVSAWTRVDPADLDEQREGQEPAGAS